MFSHVQPGQAAGRNARQENEIRESLRDMQLKKLNQIAPPPTPLPDPGRNWVWVKNTTTTQMDRWACIGLGDFEITSAANLNGFHNTPVIRAVRASLLRTPAILLQPLAPGAIGKAVVSGVVPVQINSAVANPTHAEAFWESPIMVGAGTGYPILQRETGTGTRWGWIRLGPQPTRGVAFGYHRMAQNSGWYAQLTLPANVGTSLATWRSLEMRGNCAHVLANDNDRLRFLNNELRYWRVRASCWVNLAGTSTSASFQILTNCFAEHRVLIPPAAAGFQAKTQTGSAWQHLHDELWIGTIGNNSLTAWFNGFSATAGALNIGHFELTLDEVTQFEFTQVIARTNQSNQTGLPGGPTPPNHGGSAFGQLLAAPANTFSGSGTVTASGTGPT